MPKTLLDHVKAILKNRRSRGEESFDISLLTLIENRPSPKRSVAPPNLPDAAVCHESLMGMEDTHTGSSEFLSWINGKGPYVPQPLPTDTVPQVVVVTDLCSGLTNEMFEKENLESASSQFGAHPSPLIAPLNDAWPVRGSVLPTFCNGRRRGPPIVETPYTRLNDALAFPKHFTCSSVNMVTCIWSDGTHPWSGKSCDIMWVAVHGMHSICVVTKNEDVVREVRRCMRAFDLPKEDYLEVFKAGMIHKVEELAKEISGQSSKKPFGVVSVFIGTHEESGHEASSGAEYDEEKAIKFLQDEMKSNTTFTFDKTVQTAISAFQHLFGQKFKANELRVIVWKEDGDIVKELPSCDGGSIEEHVAVIRAQGTDESMGQMYHTV